MYRRLISTMIVKTYLTGGLDTDRRAMTVLSSVLPNINTDYKNMTGPPPNEFERIENDP